MTEQKNGPLGLNRTRIFILAMGVLVLVITVSMMMGGLGSYNALKEAARANNPNTEAPAGE